MTIIIPEELSIVKRKRVLGEHSQDWLCHTEKTEFAERSGFAELAEKTN